MYCDHGIWTLLQRSAATTYCELKAVRIIHSRSLVALIEECQALQVLLHYDNLSAVHIVNSFVSSRIAMMTELRPLKRILDLLKIQINT